MLVTAAIIAHMATSPVLMPAEKLAMLLCKRPSQIILAGDPHGPDPHGDDPHDEQHDSRLPANKDRDTGKAPTDPYGGQAPGLPGTGLP